MIFRRLAFFSILIIFFASCTKNNSPTALTFWIENREIARYVELFNSTHKDIKIVLVYKENPALEIQNESPPDIIEGPWLRTERTSKNFKNITSIFDSSFKEESFYPQFLEAGKIGKKQYLLPISFNLPAVIFSTENENFLSDDYVISLEAMKDSCAEFTKKNDTESKITQIGFPVLDNKEFVNLSAKLFGTQFHKTKNSIDWNEDGLARSVEFLRDWISEININAQTEIDFAYKYLSMPGYRQVNTGRCLFAFMQSDDLFSLSPAHVSNIGYRWISKGDKLPINDSLSMIGISAKSKHAKEAKEFLKWLLSTETQKQIIEMKFTSKLDTDTFGIAGGFSSLWEVTEQILPSHYTMLMSNIPQKDALEIPEQLPSNWETIKSRVITPYMTQACSTENYTSIMPLSERIKVWERQSFH